MLEHPSCDLSQDRQLYVLRADLSWHQIPLGMSTPQALLLSVCCADVYTCMYIKGQKDPSLLWLSDLTEVGSPMISRVNNDVTLGLTTGHWSTPL